MCARILTRRFDDFFGPFMCKNIAGEHCVHLTNNLTRYPYHKKKKQTKKRRLSVVCHCFFIYASSTHRSDLRESLAKNIYIMSYVFPWCWIVILCRHGCFWYWFYYLSHPRCPFFPPPESVGVSAVGGCRTIRIMYVYIIVEFE